MVYEGKLYRPPSEADAFIVQATIGCSWNRCTYCDMYREKQFRVRELGETLEHIELARREAGGRIEKVFVADGDALAMDVEHWEAILAACRSAFPKLRRISCYAWAQNVLAKSDADLQRLRDAGLDLLYIGPESGDDLTLKRIAKGANCEEHIEASRRAKAAGFRQSVIFLLGAGGTERSQEHAEASARLASAMDPEFLSALTLTVVPGTPHARMEEKGLFVVPDLEALLRELRTFVALAEPSSAVFRTNHASNYLPIAGRLPSDRAAMLTLLDEALDGRIGLRPEWLRGL